MFEDRTTWIATFRRDQLADIVDGHRPTLQSGDAWGASKHLKSGYLLGIWVGESRSLLHAFPHIVVSDQGVLQDLYAWSGTYLRSLGPLSSLMRILTTEQFEIQLRRRAFDRLWDIVGGMVGVITAESLIRGQCSIATLASDLRPNMALSSAIFRSFSLGYPEGVMAEIVHNYLGLWSMVELQRISAPMRKLPHVATSLLGVEWVDDSTRPLFARSRGWMNELRSGARPLDIAREVIPYDDDASGGRYIDQVEEMTAEERVRMFDSVAPRIIRDGVTGEPEDSAFALALGAFICRPGFEQQAVLIDDYWRELPEAMLWLGALQAFVPMADALSIGGGIGWRLAREMVRSESIFDLPRGDVGFSEIRGEGDRISGAYRGLFERDRVDVELYPMVVATFEKAQGDSGGRTDVAQSDDRESVRRDELLRAKLWNLEKQLRESLSTTREVRQRLAGRVERGARRKPRRRPYE